VSTADARTRTFDPGDRLESDLLALFAVKPQEGVLDRLDERIDLTLRAWKPTAPRRLRVGRGAGLIGLLAASLIIGGATGNLQSLYALFTGPFDAPWHRGEEIGLSQTVDGYTVTIDRAYADATRLALAISVVDERQRAGTTQLSAFSTIVTDETGEYESGGGAVSAPGGAYAAVNVAWKQPPELPLPAGPRQLHVVLPFIMVRDDSTPPPDTGADEDGNEWDPWHRVAGPWTFDFELTVDGGTAVTPDAAAEIDGIRVTVPRLIASSDMVRVEMRIDGGLPPGDWSPVGEVRHGRQVLPFNFGNLRAGPGGLMAFMTDGGVPDASGKWTVTVKELIGMSGDERLAGPWVLEFNAP
jgi:hypothetical protein